MSSCVGACLDGCVEACVDDNVAEEVGLPTWMPEGDLDLSRSCGLLSGISVSMLEGCGCVFGCEGGSGSTGGVDGVLSGLFEACGGRVVLRCDVGIAGGSGIVGTWLMIGAPGGAGGAGGDGPVGACMD